MQSSGTNEKNGLIDFNVCHCFKIIKISTNDNKVQTSKHQ